MDWRDQLADDLVLFAKSFGVYGFDEAEVTRVFNELVIIDRGIKKDKREGYVYVSEKYTEKQFSAFIRKVEKRWDVITLPDPPVKQTSLSKCCVVSIKLDKDSYVAEDIRQTIHSYLRGALGLDVVAATKATRVIGSWYDIFIEFDCNLSKIYELVRSPDWVKDCMTKPRSAYGHRNIKMFR